ncbi:hypothetical protein GCM10009819_27850 [Agromyces tropicus]|uniref:Capsular biosynthesis protein n=1 Tax=Agromyces tropicus TaxID=555371 RepID=A0ABN2UQ28_9MICO
MLSATVRRQIAATRKTNLIANASFEVLDDEGRLPAPGEPGGYYIHVNNTGEPTSAWAATGRTSLEIVGTAESFDTHFAPEGRNGAFRVGLRAGGTYAASARVELPARLHGPLARTRLTISPGWTVRGEHRWNPLPSAGADNAPGVHEIRHRFTVPADAQGAWIRYVSGMAEGGGAVRWDDLLLVEGDPCDYFDGDTAGDGLHRHGWNGEPGRSTSFRELLPPDELFGGRSLVELADLLERHVVVPGTDDELAVVLDWVRRDRRRDPDLDYFEGRVADWEGDHDAAVTRFDAARGEGPTATLAELELGRLAHRARNWQAADTHFRAAARDESSPASIEAGYRVAAAMDRGGRLAESAEQSRAVAARDDGLPFDIERALAADPKAIWPRRVLGRFVREHLDEIRVRALEPVATASALVGTEPVFTYWHQGFDQAPPLVARCHESLLAQEGDRVHVLTGENLGQYVGLPAPVIEAVGTNYTHLSDLIRLDALTRFGGHWVDATCLFTGPIGTEPSLTGQDFFCYNYSGPRVGSWFMSAVPGGYSVSLLREAMVLWWLREGYLADYFQLHYMLEMLYWLDDRFRAEWDAASHRHPGDALAVQRALHQSNDGGTLARLASGYWVHKLTYKSDVGNAGVDTVAAAIVRGEHRGIRFDG